MEDEQHADLIAIVVRVLSSPELVLRASTLGEQLTFA